MKTLIALLLLFLSPLSATYVLFYDEQPSHEQRKKLFELLLRAEPPRVFYEENPCDLKAECLKIAPQLRIEWVPPAIWQLAAIHSFFNDPAVRQSILACSGPDWEPLSYDELLHPRLASSSNMREIVEYFDAQSKALPELSQLFFLVNTAVSNLYKRAHGSDSEMVRLAVAELPPFDQWPEKKFPFWRSSWNHNPNSAQLFYTALKDEARLIELVKIERKAHENGEWVLYRGYRGKGYPSTLELNEKSGHALSFGSTLLGGTFFSLEATALTYSKWDEPMTHSFLALSVTPKQLTELFRVGPLHPLVQLLVDGEMFHAHTKVAADKTRDTTRLNGYFMKCNRQCQDPLGYITTQKFSQEELEKAFLSLCHKSGHLFTEE